MISDILLEALDEIEDYQKSNPQMYQEYEHLLYRLKMQMRYVVRVLDTPPKETEVK